MYLREQFIEAIKIHYYKAHYGNVCQMLEALNKLAGLDWKIAIQPDVRFMGWGLVASKDGKNHSLEIAIDSDQDKECVIVACWANSLPSSFINSQPLTITTHNLRGNK